MIKVLKQALRAFEVATTPLAKDRQEVLEAVAAIKQAIKELESQEPDAFKILSDLLRQQVDRLIAAHPPQRTEQEPTEDLTYAIALQRAIEIHCKGEIVPESVSALCPHHAAKLNAALPEQPAQRTEQNFCSRCGKRTADLTTIHTCTPPMEQNT